MKLRIASLRYFAVLSALISASSAPAGAVDIHDTIRLGADRACSITIHPGDHAICAGASDSLVATLDCGPGAIRLRSPEWFLDGVPAGSGDGVRLTPPEGVHVVRASCGSCADEITLTVLASASCAWVPDLAAAFADSAMEAATGIYQPVASAPVTPSNFNELKFGMRPVTLSATGTPAASRTGAFVLRQSGANLEVWRANGTLVALPDTIALSELPVSLLVNATAPGTSILVASYDSSVGAEDASPSGERVLMTISDSLKVRMGRWPGLHGKALAGYPWFEFMRSVNDSSVLQSALDPGRHAERVGLPFRAYVVAHKTPAQWAAGNTLTDVTGGFNSATVTGGSIAANVMTLWNAPLNGGPAGTVGKGYDIVYDFGQNGTLDPGDLIDGLDDREAGCYVMRSLQLTGAYPVTETLYTGGTYLAQDLYYPSNIASLGALPVVVMSHGMGHNYQWYDYLGNHLASYGYIFVSHENNPGPGIDAAGLCTLSNLDYFLGHLGTIAGGALNGHVDTHRIALIGHSRGGEGVARAYDQVVDGVYAPSNFTADDIRYISSIAPTAYLDMASSNPHHCNYNVMWGMADWDVSGTPSCGRICESWLLSEHAQGVMTMTGVQGAGHGDFHGCFTCDPFAYGPDLIGRSATHIIAKSYELAYLEWFVKENPAAKDYLTHMFQDFKPTGMLPTATIFLTYRDPAAATIEDYEANPDPHVSSSGGAVSYDVSNLFEGLLDMDGDMCPWDAMNGMEFYEAGMGDTPQDGVVFDWTVGEQRFYQVDVVPSMRDMRGRDFISLRACQGTHHPETLALDGPLYFTIELEDGAGRTRAVSTQSYGGVTRPYQRVGDCPALEQPGWVNESQTVRIRLADFENDASGLDLGNIVAVRLRFGSDWGSSRGRIGLDNIDLPME